MTARITTMLLLATLAMSLLAVVFAPLPEALAVTADGDETATRGAENFDLDGLIDRVSSTRAIGFLTKLSLKRDIDRFESDLKKYHAQTGKLTLAQLEERYNLMVNNLMVLVQDKDAALARDIADARGYLWAKLADAAEYSKL